jgi:hypothetical protein
MFKVSRIFLQFKGLFLDRQQESHICKAGCMHFIAAAQHSIYCFIYNSVIQCQNFSKLQDKNVDRVVKQEKS